MNYFYATANTNVSIDGAANDGEAGEHDNVLADVEDLWGSPQQDTLTGSAGPNTIRGGNGNDTITGLGGRDTLAGEAGSDAMFARDGAPDEVDCGSPGGSAQIDLIDDAANCAPVDASDEAQPDHDGDGVDRPADCDDRNAARRPGLFDVPENGVDEDCSGADAPQLDRDHDGFPVPRDCDDASAAINPARASGRATAPTRTATAARSRTRRSAWWSATPGITAAGRRGSRGCAWTA